MTERKSVVMALDYDETYTADSGFWKSFIGLSRAYGHKIILATYRHPVHDYTSDFDDLKALGVECYFTDGKAKKKFLEDLGIVVNIWIDDRPATVLEDSAWGQASPELHAWRLDNDLEKKGEPRVHLEAILTEKVA